MSHVWLQLGIVALLILANALFALSEIAIVSARKTRLQQRADEGDKRAAAALRLASSPNEFLSTVQVGMTLVGVLAGAFGGVTLSHTLAERLRTVPFVAHYADVVALGVVVVSIAYVTLIFGELVPKRLALERPERMAAAVAGPMRLIATAAAPIVRLLSGSTALVLRSIGQHEHVEAPVSEEEIKLLLAQGRDAGLFEAAEQEMVARVFRLADRRVVALMTPRTRIVWLDTNDSGEEINGILGSSRYSRLIVGEGSLDNWVGYVKVGDVLARLLTGKRVDLKACLKQPLLVPEGTRALTLLERFRVTGTHIALVIDEYGGVEGLVTLSDIFAAIVGELPAPGDVAEAEFVRREDGSWLVAGTAPIEDFVEQLHDPRLQAATRGGVRTLAGFVMRQLGRIPHEGEAFNWSGFRFEVVDMDGHLVDKVLVAPEAHVDGQEARGHGNDQS